MQKQRMPPSDGDSNTHSSDSSWDKSIMRVVNRFTSHLFYLLYCFVGVRTFIAVFTGTYSRPSIAFMLLLTLGLVLWYAAGSVLSLTDLGRKSGITIPLSFHKGGINYREPTKPFSKTARWGCFEIAIEVPQNAYEGEVIGVSCNFTPVDSVPLPKYGHPATSRMGPSRSIVELDAPAFRIKERKQYVDPDSAPGSYSISWNIVPELRGMQNIQFKVDSQDLGLSAPVRVNKLFHLTPIQIWILGTLLSVTATLLGIIVAAISLFP